MRNGPVFVLSTHRSGSTLLERVLNCHPDLVIWGEHGGLINHLVEADLLGFDFPQLLTPLPDRGLADFVHRQDLTSFNPWRTPVTPMGLRRQVRGWMEETFGKGLRPRQRWGFKEISYGGADFARYMLDLFPDAQFVLLHRNRVELCISNIFAGWSLAELRTRGDFETDAAATAVIADCAYAVAAMDFRLRRTSEIAGKSALALSVEAAAEEFPNIFTFLGLAVDEVTGCEIGEVLATRLGATDKSQSIGRLTADLVRATAPELLALAERQISTSGHDRRRLLDPGGFCFLLGDHHSVGTGRSSMGWNLT